ncbi:MAG: efflux RND transporter permease subunit, partial [Steroidobacteraceae bacterium]
DLRTTIANANVNSPKGTLDGPARSWTINANDQIQSPDAYRGIVIAYRNGNPIRLSDVAEVVGGAQNSYLAGWVNQRPGIILNIQRQPGANVIQVVDRIKKLLPDLSASLPAAVEVTILTDRTNTIRASVHDVEFELSLAVILVVLVIFLFLRSIPATIIPSLSVPLSLIGTLGAMYLLGFSLNNLSLMALTIATGFVVDDAIVMIENISRYIEQGMRPLEAALRGAGEIGFTIVSLTVSLIAVLIPLLFMGDVVGRLFHEFAITLAVTIVISAVVSLTLVPMLCAKLLVRHPHEQESGIARWANEKFQALIDRYGDALQWVLDRQPMTLAVAIATLIVTILLYVFTPKGFFPVQDTGVIQAITEAPQTVSYAGMAQRQQAMAAAILKDQDVVSLSSFIGVDGSNITLNSGRMLINLKAVNDRSESASEVIRRLQRETADVTGMSLYMQPVQDLSIDDTVSRTQYQFVLEDANPAEFNTWVPRLVTALQQVPQIEDVASDQENQGLSAYLTIDRDTAGRFGITPATVDNALYDAFGQRIVSTIFTQSNQYRVILQADSSLMASLDSLGTLYLPSSTAVGGQVPLSALVSVSTRLAPLSIDHLGQFPSTTISFNLARGAALGDAVNAIRKVEQGINLPGSVMTTFQGAALAFQATLGNELFLILAAIVTVYIVLGVLYESFIHPITILSTL